MESVDLASLQRSLLKMWCEVLKVETIDVHTKFLDAGGDSIMATQLSIRIENSLGIKVSLLDLFDVPTIAQQAELLITLKENNVTSSSNIPSSPETPHPGKP